LIRVGEKLSEIDVFPPAFRAVLGEFWGKQALAQTFGSPVADIAGAPADLARHGLIAQHPARRIGPTTTTKG
jgi:hypothetical protein